jgi:hypothetical protein
MIKFVGHFEPINGRIVSGWVLDRELPGAAVPLEIFVSGERIGVVVAVSPATTAAAPLGAKAFEFLLPPVGFAPDEAEVVVRPAGQETPLPGSPRLLNPAPERDEVTGSLDNLTSEGWVSGWAYVSTRPGDRRVVEIIAGTEMVGTTTADAYRQDLETGGIGDGRHAFSFALPFEVLAQPREMLVATRDRATGQPIGKPKLLRPKPVADALAKLAALEADFTLLQAGMAQLEAQSRAETRAAADLFRTAGDFFLELSQAATAGLPASGLRSVRSAAAAITGAYRPLALDAGSAALSVCIVCHDDAALAYATLQAIAEDPAGLEVFLLDAGHSGEIPLLPLVVPGLAYVQGNAAPVAAFNQVLAAAAAPAVVFLAAGLLPSAGWAEAVLAGFNAAPHAMVLAAQIRDVGGALIQAGLTRQGEQWEPRGQGAEASAPGFANAAPVSAASALAFALRREPAIRAGGLPDAFAETATALLALCTQAAPGQVVYEPGFAVTAPEDLMLPPGDLAARAADAERLRTMTAVE